MSAITDSALSRDADDTSLASGTGSIGTLFEQPSDPNLDSLAADSEQEETEADFLGECHETPVPPEPVVEGQNGTGTTPRIETDKSPTPLPSPLTAQAALRLKPLLDFLRSLSEWCHRHAAPRPDGDEAELSWREALVETAARVAVFARNRHMRALIILFLLCAGLYSTSGVPVFGPGVDFSVWPLQAVSVVCIWVGMAVPWARGHSFGSMFKDGELSSGEVVDVLVPSALLIALGGASYCVSALFMGAGRSSWGLLQVMIFLAVSALATATAAHETAAVSRRAGQPECDCET